MMANIQEYELEYNGHINAAQEKLELAESASGAEAQKAACGAAERAAEAAKDVVQLMELEGRGLERRAALQAEGAAALVPAGGQLPPRAHQGGGEGGAHARPRLDAELGAAVGGPHPRGSFCGQRFVQRPRGRAHALE